MERRQMLADLRCGQLDELQCSAARWGFASVAESSHSAAGLTNKAVMELSFLENKGDVLIRCVE